MKHRFQFALVGLGMVSLAFLSGDRFATSKYSVAADPAPAPAVQSTDLITSAVVNTAVNTGASGSYRPREISDRVFNADIAAKNAVGGGAIQSVTKQTIHQTPAWVVTVNQNGHNWTVVVAAADYQVLSKTMNS